jgi:flagellar FliJ protein
MSRWTQSLIKIANHEVETLQKQVAEIVGRRQDVQGHQARLEAQVDLEAQHVRDHPGSGLSHMAYLSGVRQKRARFVLVLAGLDQEEALLRQALAEAFEALKKYEIVAQNIQLAKDRQIARQETAMLDEMGLRLTRGVRDYSSEA